MPGKHHPHPVLPPEGEGIIIQKFLEIIPANAGIQQPIDLKTLDSGSPLRCARNDELFTSFL